MQYGNTSLYYHDKSKMFATYYNGKWWMAPPNGQWRDFDSDFFYCKSNLLGVCM